ncbi:MAG: CARDB domain-containing protein [Thermoplasmata archaeon]
MNTRLLPLIFTAILCLSILSSQFSNQANGDSYEPVRVVISGPDTAGVKEVRTYYVNVSGGPAMAGGNYSYRAVVKGENTTGSYVTPAEGNNTHGHFEVNVTMPEKPQHITLEITATSASHAGNKSLTKEFLIEVVIPYTFKVTVKNSGNIDVYGCQIDVLVDNEKITDFKFDITRNSTYTFEYNYTGKIESPGWHTVKFVLKNTNGLIEFENGTNEISFSFYKAPPPLPKWVPLVIALILIPVVSIIILLLLGRRKKGSGKRW